MKITAFQFNEETGLYHGFALSSRGRRYEYFVNKRGRDEGASRDVSHLMPKGQELWQVLRRSPPALLTAARGVIRDARRASARL